MKRWKAYTGATLLALGVLCGSALVATGALAQERTEVTADTFEYDSATGMVVAQGGIKIVRGGQTLTGQAAEYNTKTQDAHISGGVRVVGDDLRLTAAEVWAAVGKQITAQGDVVLVKGDKRLTGSQVNYFQDSDRAVVPQGGTLFTPDGDLSANYMEAFLGEDRAVCRGSVHIVSEARKLDATSDTATYYGAKSGQDRSKIIMNGNARAVQDGNVLVGNTLSLYLDDKAVQGTGRARLVITNPNAGAAQPPAAKPAE